MIRLVTDPSELNKLPQKGVEAQKIRALLNAYGTSYDFCRFFIQNEDTYISALDMDFVLCEGENFVPEELINFSAMNGMKQLFCSEQAFTLIKPYINSKAHKINLMRFCGQGKFCETDSQPALSEVYTVLKDSFDIEFEPWYLDMSHRIRHEVSACRKLNDSVLVIQHNINNEALLSQIATKTESRGQGIATKLILAVCHELSDSDIYLLCDDDLVSFYNNACFELVDKKYIITF